MARDIYHNPIRHALEADGWTITDDPLTLRFGEQNVFVDLGAEAPLGAEKAGRKIAVEIKSFLGKSAITELERALGQFAFYRFLLRRDHPNRLLYLGISDDVHAALFDTADGRDLMTDAQVRLVVVNIVKEEVVEWIEID